MTSSLRSRRTAAAVAVAGAATAALVALPAEASTPQHRVISSVIAGKLGRVVSAKHGRVMYMFMKDTRNKSNCNSTCRQYWPRVMSAGAPTAGRDIRAGHLGRTASGQVTYYGHPLYFYVGDPNAKEHSGEGMDSFGGEWYAVSTSGKKVDR
jgi:predicted lipoprotein with Yx(FWY)xxD motif